MKLNNRDVCMFVGGAAVGTLVGGAVVIYKAFTSETIGTAISKALAEKMVDSVVEKPRYVSYNRSKHVSYCRPNNVSYKSYYTREFDTDILFETYDAADKIRDALLDVADEYGYVAVADLYDLVGIPVDYYASHYGWANLAASRISITPDRNGWMLKLPKPWPLD